MLRLVGLSLPEVGWFDGFEFDYGLVNLDVWGCLLLVSLVCRSVVYFVFGRCL